MTRTFSVLTFATVFLVGTSVLPNSSAQARTNRVQRQTESVANSQEPNEATGPSNGQSEDLPQVPTNVHIDATALGFGNEAIASKMKDEVRKTLQKYRIQWTENNQTSSDLRILLAWIDRDQLDYSITVEVRKAGKILTIIKEKCSACTEAEVSEIVVSELAPASEIIRVAHQSKQTPDTSEPTPDSQADQYDPDKATKTPTTEAKPKRKKRKRKKRKKLNKLQIAGIATSSVASLFAIPTYLYSKDAVKNAIEVDNERHDGMFIVLTEFHQRYRRSTAIAISSGVVSAAVLGTGITLILLGNRKSKKGKKKSTSFVPTLSPNHVGLFFDTRF